MMGNQLIKRINWIDLTKGIAIFLMVCGHTSMPQSIRNWIWSFHMPLFFIVSGLLYKHEKAINYGRFVCHKLFALVVPYIFFLICQLIYNSCFGIDTPITIITQGNPVGAYWFIQVLLVVELLNAILIKIASKWLYLLIIVMMSVAGFIAYTADFHLPYRLEVVGLASLFYGVGFLTKKWLFELKINIIYCFLLFGVDVAISFFIPRLDMNSNCYGSYLPNILSALFGTFCVMQICKNIDDWNDSNFIKRFFLWAGRNSIIVMGLSQIINLSMKNLISSIPMPSVVNSLSRHIFLWIILFLLSIVINKYVPFLIGKRKK